jgi:hypothetical protein
LELARQSYSKIIEVVLLIRRLSPLIFLADAREEDTRPGGWNERFSPSRTVTAIEFEALEIKLKHARGAQVPSDMTS